MANVARVLGAGRSGFVCVGRLLCARSLRRARRAADCRHACDGLCRGQLLRLDIRDDGVALRVLSSVFDGRAVFLKAGPALSCVFASGLFAGAAAASNLLTLPVLALVFLRILIRDKRRVLVFVAGAAIAIAPLLVLLAQSPGDVLFNLVGYHLADRPSLGWRFNVRQMVAWFWSVQGAMLTALAILAFWFRRTENLRGARLRPPILHTRRRSVPVERRSALVLFDSALFGSADRVCENNELVLPVAGASVSCCSRGGRHRGTGS